MILVRLQGVGKSYGGEAVIQEVTWQIDSGHRIGIVGDNGAGKSTLFGIITGEIVPDEGQVILHRGLRVGMLTQHPDLDMTATPVQEILASHPGLMELERKVERLAELISDPASDPQGRGLDRLLDLHAEALEAYDHAGGHDFEARVGRTLAGLGLPPDHHAIPIRKLSGGQRSRVALAKVLLAEVDLLLLDEPTNHLDIQAIEWLQEFLNRFPGTFVAISHDRCFLDAACRRILEIEDTRAREYAGGFTRYTETKEHEIASQTKAYEVQAKEIQRQEEWIRWRAGQATPKAIRMAKVRARALARVERLARPTIHRPRPTLKFAQPRSRSAIAMELVDLEKRFGDRVLFRNLSLVLNGGNRLGLVGPNGTGKTTLLRIILGETAATSGIARLGQNVRVGYYAQDREELDVERTVFDHVAWVRPDLKPVEIRTFLGRFLFCGEEVFLPIGVLSGGERSRVALALLILSQPDFLVLDEPTNHLDIASCEVFEDALCDYQGTLLIASHDRYFLDRTVDRLLVMGSEEPLLFHGNYSALSTARAEERARREAEEAARKAEERRQRRIAAGRRPAAPSEAKEIRSRRVLQEQLEQRIAETETRLSEVTELLGQSETYGDGERARGLSLEYDDLQRTLGLLYEQYEDVL